MPTAAFANLGCKVNQYETERLAETFEGQGFTLADFDELADVYVINTCSVTSAADRKSRLLARQAARRNPAAHVVLTGCFAQTALDHEQTVEGATLLVPNIQKMQTALHLLEAFPHLAAAPAPQQRGMKKAVAVFPEPLIAPASLLRKPEALHRTRGTLKVQDGCTYYCAFCSIPYTRPALASRPFGEVLAEAQQMADSGIKEIVVTGVCVGAYGKETGSGGARLVDILTGVADIPGIERVRLSSVQPVEIPEEMIDAMAAHPHIAPHLHLSLQSGDDVLLKAMHRPYDTHFFADHVARLRQAMPRIGLTTDLIVGFPGETRALFENTLAFAAKMQFARTHVFRYSPRSRTTAADLKDDVPSEEKERRHKELSKVCLETQREFVAGDLDQVVSVLVEGRGVKPSWLSGYTGNYIRVQFEAPDRLRGQIVPVRLLEVTSEGDAIGELDFG